MARRRRDVERESEDGVLASGVTGWGSLRFTVPSAPGVGRLVRLPFYPSVTPVPSGAAGESTIVTFNGSGLPSTTHPVFFTTQIVTFAGGTPYTLRTPNVAWAKLRVVGFEVLARGVAQLVGTDAAAATADGQVGPATLVQDLHVDGGPNIFTHSNWADARLYDADFPEFAGLRDYPLVISPTRANVTINQVGVIDDITSYRVTLSCNLLCDVLVDDNYGTHIPGPYARTGALVRNMPKERSGRSG